MAETSIEQIIIDINDEALDEALAKIDGALSKKEELKGMNRLTSELTSMLPGLSQARNVMNQMKSLIAISPEIAVALIAFKALKRALTYYQELEEERRAYERLIRSYRMRPPP